MNLKSQLPQSAVGSVAGQWSHSAHLPITCDRSLTHEDIAKEIGCDTYFAKPYHSWERGQNENANGLLRQYFPKALGMIDITMKQVVEAIDKLNSRPRKCLNFKSPYEAFEKLRG